MTESVIFTLPEETSIEYTQTYIVPVRDDGSIHLDRIHFRAHQAGSGVPSSIIVNEAPILAVGRPGIYSSTNGIDWVQRSGAISGGGHSACTFSTGAQLWIVGMDKSTPDKAILISQTGTSWTEVSTPWDGIAGCWALGYSPPLDLIVAVTQYGDALGIMTSSDGIHWTERSSPWDNTGQIEDVAWIPFLNQFVLVANMGFGSPGTIGTSFDGITWTAQTTPIDPVTVGHAAFMLGIGHSDGLAVACGSIGINSTPPFHSILTSTDGVNWDFQTGSTDSNSYDCAWHDGLYVVGTNNQPFDSIETSTDGITWTAADSQLSYVNAVTWSPTCSKFIGVGEDSSLQPGIISSPDGVTWTTSPVNGTMVDVWDIEAT